MAKTNGGRSSVAVKSTPKPLSKSSSATTHPHPTVHAKAHKSKTVILKPHHRKAYRKRHFGFLALTVAFAVLLALQTGIMLGQSHFVGTAPAVSDNTAKNASSITVVRSSYGYSLALDSNLFTVAATVISDTGVASAASAAQLHQTLLLSSVAIKPQEGAIKGIESAARLSLEVNPSQDALSKQKAIAANAGMSEEEIASQLFTITPTNDLDVSVLSSKKDTLNSVPVQKTVYQLTPRSKGGTVYAVVWSGVTTSGRAFAVKLQGLVGSSNVPTSMATIFESINIDSSKKVLGSFTSLAMPKAAADSAKLDQKYISNAYSPAVVKVYRVICGALLVSGQPILGDTSLCTGGTGTGFIVTSDGYIATNGHVAVMDASDLVIDIINQLATNDTATLTKFLHLLGYSTQDIQFIFTDPSGPASLFADILAAPAGTFDLKDKADATMVSLGSKPAIDFEKVKNATDLSTFIHDSQDIKVANLISSNYNRSDLYKGTFDGSDVALLKINISNAPIIRTSKIQGVQNEKIIVLGFPGNAENALTDNKELSVSVTDGVISAVRTASGGKGKLYQTDASASHGNSGGPVLGEDGAAIGLLTYVIAGDNAGNQPKTYIRDINDFIALADAKHISLNGSDTTQETWEKGLALYDKSHFSAAIKQFNKVQASYPSHRLVGSYIDTAQQNIAAGKDVKDFPVALIIGGLAIALVAAGIAVFLIIRHRSHHQLYQAYQPAMPAGGPAPGGFPVNVPISQAAGQPVYGQAATPSMPQQPPQPLQPLAQVPAQPLPAPIPQPATAAPQPQVVIQPTVITPTQPTDPTIPPAPPQQ